MRLFEIHHEIERILDVLLFYARSGQKKWNQLYQPYEEAYIEQYYRYREDSPAKAVRASILADG